MQLLLIFGIIVAIGAVMFALQNNTHVIVTLGMWSFEGSLALVLLATLGFGVLIAGLLSSPTVIRGQWTMGRLRSRVTELERQLSEQQQRGRDLEAELARSASLDVTPAPVKERPYVGLRTLFAGSASVETAAQLEAPSEETSRK
jgi:putative membrane protein